MTVSYTTTSTPTTESEENLFPSDNPFTEDASTLATMNINLIEGQQCALLRSISETCMILLFQAGAMFSQSTSNKLKPKPEESLLIKNGMLTKALLSPKSKSTTYQSSPSSNTQSLLGQTIKSSKMEKQLMKENAELAFSSCSTPNEETPITKTIIIILQSPLSKEVKEQSRHKSSFITLEVKTYSQQIIKEHTTKEHDSKHTESQKSKDSTLSKSTILSPMGLFSQLRAEISKSLQTTKSQEKEEGLGEQGQQQQDDHSEQEKQPKDIEEIDESSNVVTSSDSKKPYSQWLPKPVVEFALSEAQLSTLFHSRVTNLDVLRICAEIMKLMIHSREQDNLSRLQARQLLFTKAQALISSYEYQAKITQWLGVATAVLGILGALSPIIGEISGDKLLSSIQKNTGFWKTATARTFFKSTGKIFSSLSQLTEAASKIYELKETATRTFAEHYKEIFRIEHDDITRSIEEIKDHWKNMDNFLLHMLQTDHDTIRNLYQ
ncbi:hypothetical protein [Candidatus Chlamydia sanziniae]|uniref:Uncharacterized protein n=1 Tax=Candidatus Chlamydia sanziniae TaxID=1806891 RepID=A0A1A9HXJ5_9CHLA|nr:hypothetical protein [Candidatus Chlamydia sanziniae]ANH78812.1 hypothetical protein Cs308_0642 [Candidatus Chlamydia sanziniae]